MDLNEYIASGIVENYVLGTVSDQERQEVECMSHIYPEIKTAIIALQENIEKLALKSQVNPPEQVKVKVMTQIKSEAQEGALEQTKVIPINKVDTTSSQSSKGSKVFKYMSAASIILLIGVGVYAFMINADLNTAKEQVADSGLEYQEMVKEFNALNQLKDDVSNELANLTNQMNFVSDQNTAKVNLAGTADYSDNLAIVFWNQSSKKVLLDIKNLPYNSSEESYQLWVLVDGQPIDMGVFDHELTKDALGLLEMKTTENADAFAITREPKGGSLSPTLEQLHVIGMI